MIIQSELLLTTENFNKNIDNTWGWSQENCQLKKHGATVYWYILKHYYEKM